MHSDIPTTHSNHSASLMQASSNSFQVSQLYLQRLMNYKLTEPIVLEPIDICFTRCKDLSTPTKSILRNKHADSLRAKECAAEARLRFGESIDRAVCKEESPGKKVRFSRNKIVKVFASKGSSLLDDS